MRIIYFYLIIGLLFLILPEYSIAQTGAEVVKKYFGIDRSNYFIF